jgi:hypothetical protein
MGLPLGHLSWATVAMCIVPKHGTYEGQQWVTFTSGQPKLSGRCLLGEKGKEVGGRPWAISTQGSRGQHRRVRRIGEIPTLCPTGTHSVCLISTITPVLLKMKIRSPSPPPATSTYTTPHGRKSCCVEQFQ